MAYTTPMHNVVIDTELCGNALECLKCVHACIDAGHNCLMFINTDTPVVTSEGPKSLQDIPHMVKAMRMWECSGCQDCVKACPKGAVTFVPAKRHLPRAKVERPGYVLNCTVLHDGRKTWEPDYVEEVIYVDD